MPGHRAGGDLLGGAEAAAGRGALESGRVTARYRGLGRRRLGLQRRKLENSLFCSPEPPKFQHVQRRSPRSGVHLVQVPQARSYGDGRQPSATLAEMAVSTGVWTGQRWHLGAESPADWGHCRPRSARRLPRGTLTMSDVTMAAPESEAGLG